MVYLQQKVYLTPRFSYRWPGRKDIKNRQVYKYNLLLLLPSQGRSTPSDMQQSSMRRCISEKQAMENTVAYKITCATFGRGGCSPVSPPRRSASVCRSKICKLINSQEQKINPRDIV
jgi:hypothetical protein